LSVNDGQFAQVREMNWRSTRLRTNDDVYLDIPNRELARQTIINLHYPDSTHGMRITVGVEHNAPPSAVKDALLRATAGAPGVLEKPEPQVFLKDFGDHAILYEIRFWLDDQALYNAACDVIRTNSWYELRRAGIRIPVSPSTVRLERGRERAVEAAPETVRKILQELPLFRSLDDFERETLLEGARPLRYGRGERIILQEEEGASMFVMIAGSASVAVDRGQGRW
jgi:small-conductance mechanosensitive channel